jgi:hypothetical protein
MSKVPNQTRLVHSNALECAMVQPGAASHKVNLVELVEVGRQPLQLDNAAIQRDRRQGQSLRQIAKEHRISTATVRRVLSGHPPQTLDKTA